MNTAKQKRYDFDSNPEFEALVDYIIGIIGKKTGNHFGDSQRAMVKSRLQKRMLHLQISAPTEYHNFVKFHYKAELEELIGLLTTHHTFFFREFAQLSFLQEAFSSLESLVQQGDRDQLMVWSAACSTGEEVYTLAMYLKKLLDERKESTNIRRYTILGTDIDSKCIKLARNGVYKRSDLERVPRDYVEGNWLSGTGEISDFCAVKASLKNRCQFEVHNILDPTPFDFLQKFDVVFCRNVLIYFDHSTVELAVKMLLKRLLPGGYLICGVSESITNLSDDLVNVAPGVYKKTVGGGR